MVTKTVYTDLYQVVIDIGAVPPTEEWLQETTYLIDRLGHTTAILAQTDQPTQGVSLQPLPFTPAGAQVSLGAPPTTTPGLAPTASHLNSGNSDTVIGLAAVGVVFGVVIMAATLYLLRRRALRQRRRAHGSLLFSEDSAGSGSSTSSNRVEKFFDEFKTSRGEKPALTTEEVMPSGDGIPEVEREHENLDATSISSGEGFGSDSAKFKQGHDQLPDRHRSISAHVGFAANTWEALPAIKVSLSTTRQTGEKMGAVAQPTSILKRPARKGLRLMDAVQGMLGIEDGSRMAAPEPKTGAVKKTVTFGNAEIREFGRTPLPSSAGSILSRDNADGH